MRLLCYLCHQLLDFRVPDVEAAASLAGCDNLQWSLPYGGHHESPFWYISLPSEGIAASLAERAALLKVAGPALLQAVFHLHRLPLFLLADHGRPAWRAIFRTYAIHQPISSRPEQFLRDEGIYVTWAEAETWEALLEILKGQRCSDLQAHLTAPDTFKIQIETLGYRIPRSEGVNLIQDLLEVLHFQGTVDLAAASRTFTIIRSKCDAGLPGAPNGLRLVPHAASDFLIKWYIGRNIATGGHGFASRYKLQNRPYKGSTSMPAELAHLMCNQAKVTRGSLVYDPFAGTGSILLAASHFKAVTLGMDIDTRVMHPGTRRSPESSNVFTNFRHYQLEMPAGLVLGDTHRPPFRPGLMEFLDAIVCDPPYGIRERARKTQSDSTAEIRNRGSHVPSTLPYTLGECVWDLLDFSASMLRPGGRLVFWVPSGPQVEVDNAEFPIHPCLSLLHSSIQVLGGSKYGRRLLTLEKKTLASYDDSRADWNSMREEVERCMESICNQAIQSSKISLASKSGSVEPANTTKFGESNSKAKYRNKRV